MKFSLAVIFASATGLTTGAEDWKDRRLKAREPVDANRYATEEETYQAILDYDLKRSRMLRDQLEHHQHRLEEHSSGRRLLDGEEHHRTLRQISVFSRHLERLESEGEREKLEKVKEARESLHNMHRVDYLDYGKTGI